MGESGLQSSLIADKRANWLFIEPGLSGHHSTYLEHVVAYAIERGLGVIVVLSDSDFIRTKSAEFRARVPGVVFVYVSLPEACTQNASGFAKLVRKDLSYWYYCREAYRLVAKTQALDMVFLPYMDYCLYAFGLLGSPFGQTPFEGICMRPSFHFQEMGVIAPKRRSDIIKKYLFGRLLRVNTLRRLFTNDETLALYAQRKDAVEWRKVNYFPDPAEFSGNHTRGTARSILGIAADVPVILVYGLLDERKGIHYLLSGMARTDAPENLVLLLVGQCTDSIRTLLRGQFAQKLLESGRLIILDRRVSDEEEQMCFVAADMCWLGYDDHFSMSGVLVKAVQARHLIIAGRHGLIQWYASRLRGAVTVNVEAPVDVAGALSHCMRNIGTSHHQARDSDEFSDNSWTKCTQILFE